MIRNTQSTYGSVAKTFHWLIFFLVTFMIFLGYFMDDISDKPWRSFWMNTHKLIGLSIFLLMILRLLWALANPKPFLPDAKAWERKTEVTVHVLLYVVLLAMPIAGWVMAVTAGHPPHLFNFHFDLPLEKNENVSDVALNIHNTLAIVIIVLASAHILAALYHYIIRKDKILQRMLPDQKN